jgi:hypothetical protein
LSSRQCRDYRAIGKNLSFVLRQRQGQLLSTASLQAIAADLVGENTDLLPPLKDLVSRPSFQSLISKASCSRQTMERLALLSDMSETYTPTVMAALEELLDGFFDVQAPARAAAIPKKARYISASQPQEEIVDRSVSALQAEPNSAISPRRQNKATSPIVLILGACAAISILAVNYYEFARSSADAESITRSYGAFLEALEAGNISRVMMREDRLGTAQVVLNDGHRFLVTLLPDEGLLEQLKNQKVDIAVQQPRCAMNLLTRLVSLNCIFDY